MSDINEMNISRIEITPKDANIKVNEKIQFNAVLFDEKGDIITTISPKWNITPDMGYVTQKGLYDAGNHAGTVAVVVKAGLMVEYAVVNVKPELPDYNGIIIEHMLRQLFGIPDNDK